MNRSERVAELLGALQGQKYVAIRFARRCGLKDPEFADMAIQEAALRIVASGGASFVADRRSLSAYVGRIVRNTCVWLLRSFYRQPGLPLGIEPATNDFDPVAKAMLHEELADADEALDRLSIADRELAMDWARRPARRLRDKSCTGGSTRYVREHRARNGFGTELVAVRASRIRDAQR